MKDYTMKSKIFTLDSESYTTDDETINVLRSIIPDAKATNDNSAVIAVMALGLKTGRIKEMQVDVDYVPARTKRFYNLEDALEFAESTKYGYSIWVNGELHSDKIRNPFDGSFSHIIYA